MAVPRYPLPVAGGLERQAHELSKALVRRGHAVHALSGRFDPGQANEESLDGVWIHRVSSGSSGRANPLGWPMRLGTALVRLRPQVDLVHLHNVSWFGAFVTLAAKGLGLPVMTKLPNIGDYGIPGMRSAPFGRLRVELLKQSDVIVAMTPDSLEELASVGYPHTRALRVTNGILLSPLGPKDSRARASDALVAVFVGRLSPEKGLTHLLYAWKQVMARSSRQVVLRLVGEGPQGAELGTLAETLGLGQGIEFVGYSGNVSHELAGADLFVLPSYAEGNSNAILEAMRAGLPVVATRVGGAEIQVGHEGHGLLVPPRDREALAARLLELIGDPQLRIRIGTAMRQRVEGVFAIERVAAVYEQAYEKMLSDRRDEVGAINAHLRNLASEAF